jgi:hypothetical protein
VVFGFHCSPTKVPNHFDVLQTQIVLDKQGYREKPHFPDVKGTTNLIICLSQFSLAFTNRPTVVINKINGGIIILAALVAVDYQTTHDFD